MALSPNRMWPITIHRVVEVYAVQPADLCIYAVNWGFRLPGRGMDAPQREEIANMFGADLAALQNRGQGVRAGRAFDTYGIFHVPDPYDPRPAP